MDDLPGTCEDCGAQGPTVQEMAEMRSETGDPVVALHDCDSGEWTVYRINLAMIDRLSRP